MSWGKGKVKGGSGGKRGHSNMDHWLFNSEEKENARVRSRLETREQVREGIREATVGVRRKKT